MAIKQRAFPGGHRVISDSALAPTIDPSYFSPYYWEARDAITGQAKGRGSTLFIEDENQQWVLRHYKRGGLIGKLLDDQYLFTSRAASRPFREFALLHQMKQLSLPAPTPVGGHIQRRGLIYRANLITQRIPDSVDLHQCLTGEALELSLWHRIGEVIAQFHAHQIYHHDLNVRNIMLDRAENVWLIDFDRCEQRKGNKWKSENLARLRRSFEKEQAREAEFHWDENAWQTLLKGYEAS